jgi:UDP-N-acetylglucosamine enolpyruvyl transferase
MEQSDQDHLMALAAQQEEAGISFDADRKSIFTKQYKHKAKKVKIARTKRVFNI